MYDILNLSVELSIYQIFLFCIFFSVASCLIFLLLRSMKVMLCYLAVRKNYELKSESKNSTCMIFLICQWNYRFTRFFFSAFFFSCIVIDIFIASLDESDIVLFGPKNKL